MDIIFIIRRYVKQHSAAFGIMKMLPVFAVRSLSNRTKLLNYKDTVHCVSNITQSLLCNFPAVPQEPQVSGDLSHTDMDLARRNQWDSIYTLH
jgi:hypothetical protein